MIQGDKGIKRVCFTGHRDVPSAHALLLPALVEQQIRLLIRRGAVEFRAGGAIGFDMLAALKVLELKQEFPDVQLHLFLPCRDQTRGWDEVSRRAYQYVLDLADEVNYTAQTYTSGCMLARDRRLVEGSDVCLAYCTRNRGGTFYTYSYASRQGLELINLADQMNSR